MRLGILYYGLGLIPEAIAEGERVVHLAPSSKWYKYDLAKLPTHNPVGNPLLLFRYTIKPLICIHKQPAFYQTYHIEKFPSW